MNPPGVCSVSKLSCSTAARIGFYTVHGVVCVLSVCMSVCRDQHQIGFLCQFLRQGLSSDLELTNWARTISHWDPGSHLSVSTAWGLWAHTMFSFLHGTKDPPPGPHACMDLTSGLKYTRKELTEQHGQSSTSSFIQHNIQCLILYNLTSYTTVLSQYPKMFWLLVTVSSNN